MKNKRYLNYICSDDKDWICATDDMTLVCIDSDNDEFYEHHWSDEDFVIDDVLVALDMRVLMELWNMSSPEERAMAANRGLRLKDRTEAMFRDYEFRDIH